MLRVYKVQWPNDERVGSIESYVEGDWIKYNNNTGDIDRIDEVNSQKVNAFSHFVLAETRQQATVLDLQGTVLDSKDCVDVSQYHIRPHTHDRFVKETLLTL